MASGSIKSPSFGKLLWSGNFSSGSITVPGAQKYKAFVMSVSGVPAFGSSSYGVGGYGSYGTMGIEYVAYRLAPTINSDSITWSIDSINKGGRNSSGSALAITGIVGLF